MGKYSEKIVSAIREMLDIWREEYEKIFTDFGVMLLFLGATIAYPLIYAGAYAPEVLSDTPIAVVDQDQSSTSRNFLQMVDATQEIKIEMIKEDLNQARQAFFEGKVQGILVIPEDFTKEIMRGEQAHLSVFCDGSYFLHYKQVYQGVATSLATLNAGVQIKRLMASGIPEEAAIKSAQQVRLNSYPLYNPASGYGSYVMPALLILILQQTMLMGIGMLGGTDRERKAFHYLAPFAERRGGAVRVVLGKASAYVSIYFILAFYMLVLVIRWFHIPQNGNPLHILSFIIPFLLASAFLGLFLASFFKNREVSMIVLLFTSIPLIFMAGFSWPWESFPTALKWLAQVAPSTHAVRGFLKINQMGTTLYQASDEWLILWFQTILFFVLARWRMQIIVHHSREMSKKHPNSFISE
ncbi:ABC transporter permease [Thermophagus sp. OGC60D27]|uniref:ABC transporter permease n=1 Tax=Thermophagus sp. OGC60D27 TaxID=3458415 RepID=UPI004037FD65